jgi:hypothetical protein
MVDHEVRFDIAAAVVFVILRPATEDTNADERKQSAGSTKEIHNILSGSAGGSPET